MMDSSLNRINLLRNQLGIRQLRKIKPEEVAKHNKEDDCWVILFDKVYNMTKFMTIHPPGKEEIMQFAGKDGTARYDMLHFKEELKKVPPKSIMGVIDRP